MDTHSQLHDGSLYQTTDEKLIEAQKQRMELLFDYNQTRPHEVEKREMLLHEMLAEIGENSVIEPPFFLRTGEVAFSTSDTMCTSITTSPLWMTRTYTSALAPCLVRM